MRDPPDPRSHAVSGVPALRRDVRCNPFLLLGEFRVSIRDVAAAPVPVVRVRSTVFRDDLR